MIFDYYNNFSDMSDIISESDLTIKVLKSLKINQWVKRDIMLLCKEFINKSINWDFTVN